MEKTIFLRFMFAMSILSIVMTLVELVQLTSKPVFRLIKRGIRASGCINRVKNDPMTRNDFKKVFWPIADGSCKKNSHGISLFQYFL